MLDQAVEAFDGSEDTQTYARYAEENASGWVTVASRKEQCQWSNQNTVALCIWLIKSLDTRRFKTCSSTTQKAAAPNFPRQPTGLTKTKQNIAVPVKRNLYATYRWNFLLNYGCLFSSFFYSTAPTISPFVRLYSAELPRSGAKGTGTHEGYTSAPTKSSSSLRFCQCLKRRRVFSYNKISKRN